MFSQASVKNSVHRGGGCIPAYLWADTSKADIPPGRNTPPPALRDSQQEGGMHPTGMHSCLIAKYVQPQLR